jgi:hypothetical protein
VFRGYARVVGELSTLVTNISPFCFSDTPGLPLFIQLVLLFIESVVSTDDSDEELGGKLKRPCRDACLSFALLVLSYAYGRLSHQLTHCVGGDRDDPGSHEILFQSLRDQVGSEKPLQSYAQWRTDADSGTFKTNAFIHLAKASSYFLLPRISNTLVFHF